VVDYSSIYNGPGGVMQTMSFWDQGVMATWRQQGLFKHDLAWVEGLGPNQATPGGNGFGTKASQDFVARLDLTHLFPGLLIGGSAYHGQAYAAPGVVGFPLGPKLFTGVHFKYATFGKGFGIEGEFINREVDRGAIQLQVTQYFGDSIQLAMTYDHVTDYRSNALDSTRYLGGVNFFPGGPLRISLNQMGLASGPSQRPFSSRTIVQTQVLW
jgi:hypothetical protein